MFINRNETVVHIPEEDQAKRSRSSDHTVIFVAPDPTVASGTVCVSSQKLVGSKSAVDEAVDVGGGEVGTGGIDVARELVQVGFVDVFWLLWLHDVKFSGQSEEVAGKMGVGHGLSEVINVW